MNFLLSPELIEFGSVLRKFFETNVDSRLLRAQFEPAASHQNRTADLQQLWLRLSEIGALSAHLDEEYGGLNFGFTALHLILEESARVLAPLPLFETLVLGAVPIRILGNDESKRTLLTDIVAGKLRVTGAFGASFPCSPEKTTISAVSSTGNGSSEYVIDGQVGLVPSVEAVNGIIVPATVSHTGELALFLVSGSEVENGRITIERQQTFDLVRHFSQLTFSHCPAIKVSVTRGAAADWKLCRDIISAMAVAELTAAGEKVLEMTIAHTKTRNQFGRPIASFQAVAHRLADMKVELESAQALSRFAVWALEGSSAQAKDAIAASKGYASEQIPKLIESGLQAHGGIGFTHEYDLHLYLRRARMMSVLYGTSQEHYQVLGASRLR